MTQGTEIQDTKKCMPNESSHHWIKIVFFFYSDAFSFEIHVLAGAEIP